MEPIHADVTETDQDIERAGRNRRNANGFRKEGHVKTRMEVAARRKTSSPTDIIGVEYPQSYIVS